MDTYMQLHKFMHKVGKHSTVYCKQHNRLTVLSILFVLKGDAYMVMLFFLH